MSEIKQNTRKRTTRSGGRAARKTAALKESSTIIASPYITRNIPYFNLYNDEQLEIIETNADIILQEIGIEFRGDGEILQIWRDAGANVKGERVRFEKGMLRKIITKTAPSLITQHARNPKKTVKIGQDNMVMAPGYGSPFIRSLDEGRRYGTIEDFRNFVKLTYMSPALHHSGGTLCEPVDLPVNKRHLDMVYSHIKYSDKPFMGSVTAPNRAQDSVDMVKIVFGDDFVDKNCVLVNLINANSPMVFDDTMLGALKIYAKNNQACIVSPFILSGAMSPVTAIGTLTQILAEAMAGIALTQLIRPGTPVIFGTFASSISMQSGAPTFGTAEPSLVLYGAAQLARRLGVPFRSGGGLTASKIADAQAAYEAANTMQAAALAGVNFMLHTAGWLEGGLTMGYEKFVMDADQAAMIGRFLEGPDMSENGQGLAAIREVGPGNHYLGCQHTQDNFKDAFYRSPLADNNSFEQWQDEGSKDMVERANIYWKKMLNEYQTPKIDEAIDEELLEYMVKKKSATPDSNI